MKAAIYRDFGGQICVEDVPIPQIASDGILVQVKATGVCRSDWHGWKGHDGDVRHHGLPFCPGHELSGIVVKSGPNVSNLLVGDRVVAPFILSCGSCHYCDNHRSTVCLKQEQPGFTFWGSFAEYVSIPRADWNVKKLPNNVSFIQAAALGCRFTTAYRAVLQQGRFQAGETIAVFGCGGVGLSCVMIAAAKKAHRIIAVDVSKRALEKAKDLGATHVILCNDNTQVRNEVKELGPVGDGADVCIDAAGFPSSCENAVHSTRRAGRMVQVGLPIGDVSPNIPMGLVAGWEIEILGSHGFAADNLCSLLEMISNGSLNPGNLVEKQVSLAEGAQSLIDMDHGSPLGITMITKFHESRL
jgi:alcohol dehydrogenase